MTSLFELSADALRLQRQIEEHAADLFSDDDDERAAATAALEALLAAEDGNRRALLQKADAWCWVIEQLRATAAARKTSAQRLADLAADDSHRADALQQQLVDMLSTLDPEQTTWQLPEHKLTSRRTTAVEVADVADLSDRFVRVKTTYMPDKTAIKAALQQGQDVPGAALVERRSWLIK